MAALFVDCGRMGSFTGIAELRKEMWSKGDRSCTSSHTTCNIRFHMGQFLRTASHESLISYLLGGNDDTPWSVNRAPEAMRLLTAAAWQPFYLAQVSRQLELMKDPGPQQPESHTSHSSTTFLTAATATTQDVRRLRFPTKLAQPLTP